MTRPVRRLFVLLLVLCAALPARAAVPACFADWWRGKADEVRAARGSIAALFPLRAVADLARTAADPGEVARALDAVRAMDGTDPLVASEIDAQLLTFELEDGRLDSVAARRARLGLVPRFWIAGPFKEGSAPADPRPVAGDASWRRESAMPSGALPLDRYMTAPRKSSALAAFYLRVARRAAVAIRWGADDRAELFVDGQARPSPAGRHGISFDQAAAFVRLEPGLHRVVFRVEQDEGAWSLIVRLTDPDGGPLPAGVTAEVPEDLAAAEREAQAVPAGRVKDVKGRAQTALLEKAAARGEGRALAAWALDLDARDLPDRQSDQATGIVRRAAAAAPADPDVWWAVQTVESDGSRRRAALEKMLALEPNHPAALRYMTGYLLGFGQEDASRAMAERALAACAAPDPYLVAWRAMARDGRDFPAAALQTIDALARDWPQLAFLESRVFDLARRLGLTATARRTMERHLERHPGDGDARAAFVTMLAEAGDGPGALAAIDKALAIDPGSTAWRLRRAQLAAAQRETARARADVDEVLRHAPDDTLALTLRGELLLAAGDGAGAAAAWRRASDLGATDQALAERIAAVTGVNDTFGAEWTVTLADATAREAAAAPSGDPPVVVLSRTAAVSVRPDGLGSRFTQEILRVRHPDQADDARVRQFTYSPSLQRATVLEARVVRRDGSVLLAERSDRPLLPDPEIRMWYDTRVVTLSFPRLAEGDLIEVRWRLTDRGPDNPIGAGYFGEVSPFGGSDPVLAARYVVDAPAALPVRFKLLHLPAPETVRHEVRGDRTVDVVELPPLPAYAAVGGAPPPLERIPYAVAGTATGWDALGRTYQKLIERRAALDTDLVETVKRVTKGTFGKKAAAHAIYRWVIENTRYVALEFGVHALEPYPVTAVFHRRFGDCKDKAALMVAMLREARGIKAEVVLLRTRDLGQVDTTIPVFGYFDHAIVHISGEDLFLDGTVLHHAPGELPLGDRGCLALLVDPEAGGRLTATPAATPDDAVVERRETIAPWRDGGATVAVEVRTRGERAAEERTYFRQQDQPQAILSARLRHGFPDVTLRNSDFGRFDLDEPEIGYRFSVDATRLGRPEGRSVSLPLALFVPALPLEPPSPGRPAALVLPPPGREREEVVVTLPPGAHAAALPRSGTAPSRWGNATLDVRETRDAVRITIELEQRGGTVEVAEIPEFAAWTERVRQVLSQRLALEFAPVKRLVATIVLVFAAGAAPAPPDGWAAAHAGHDAEAEELFAAALAARPGDAGAALGLAELLSGRGDTAGAQAVLAGALAHEPHGLAAAGAFVRLLMLTTRAPDGGAAAIPLLADVVAGRVAVDDPEMRSHALLALADILARTGAPERGRELLVGPGGRLTRWSLLGPYGKFERLDIYRPFPPETGDVDPSDDPPGAGGLRPFRTDVEMPDGRVTVPPQFRSFGVVFAASDIVVDADVTLRLRAASSSSFALAVDGRTVATLDRERDAPPGAVVFTAQLARGRHRVLVKLANSGRAQNLGVSLEPLGAHAGEVAPVRTVPVAPGTFAASQVKPAAVPLDDLARAAGDRLPDALAAAWWLRARHLDADAGARIEAAAAAHPDASIVAFALAEHLVGAYTGADPQKDLARARVLCDRLAAGDGRWLSARIVTASLDEQAGRLDEAWQAAEKALAGAPDDPDALLLEHRIAARRGWTAEADDRIERARAAAPGRAELLEAAASYYRHIGAATRLGAALAERVRRGQYDDDWPTFLAGAGRSADALRAWEQVAAAQPLNTAAWIGLAHAAADDGRFDAAHAALERAMGYFPQDAGLVVETAVLAALEGRGDDAVRALLERALDLDPSRLDVREALRVRGAPDPLAPYLVDGRKLVAEAKRPGAGTDSALLGDLATVIVDRTGGQTEQYQGIHAVFTRAGVEREGELEVLPGARLSGLRLYKPDGRTVDIDPGAKRPVSLPGLEPGDVIDYAWRRYIPPSPITPGGLDNRTLFLFQGENRDFVLSRYVVIHDAKLDVGVCAQETGLARTDETRDGLRIRTWTAREMPQLRPEPHTADPFETIPNVKLGLATGWDDIGGVVQSMLAAVLRDDPPLPSLADEIRRRAAAAGGTPEALARALHAVLSERVKPGGQALALGIPASVAASAGEGNRVTIALALAKRLGLDARLVLARPIEMRGTSLACPSPDLFPYALVQLRLPAGEVYLDYTDADFPFDTFPLRLAGSDALAVPLDPSAPAQLIDLPRRDTGFLQQLQADLTLDQDGRVSGLMTLTTRGPLAAVLRKLLGEVPKDRREAAMRSLAASHFAGAEIIASRVTGEDDRGGDLVITLGIKGGAFARRTPAGFALPVTHQPLSILAEYATLPGRHTAMLVDTQEVRRDVLRVRIPEGMTVGPLPSTTGIENRFGAYNASVRVEEDRLVLERQARVPPQRVEPADYDAFRDFARAVDDAERGEATLAAASPSLGRGP